MSHRKHATTRDYYLAHVIQRGADECWGWSGHKDRMGYGQFSRMDGGKQRTLRAHRVAYELHVGTVAAGLDVMHRCHNPVCSNPKHLTVGTRTQNMKTSQALGRLQRKIPLADLPAIRVARALGVTLRSIGDHYGCTKQAVRHMLALGG